MLQAFFTGLSGMFSFSKSLDTVSDNVANMNTTGFRGTNSFFRSVSGANNEGFGSVVDSTATRLIEGEIRSTGNGTDAAISGSGWFVLRNAENNYFYTRAGQFQFDDDNILVDVINGYEVMGISENGSLDRIDISDNRQLPSVATSEVNFTGNLSDSATEFEVSPVTVTTSNGEAVDLTLRFSRSDAANISWGVEILDVDSNILAINEVRFDARGTPLAGYNEITAELSLGDDETQAITFGFGEAGGLSGATELAVESSLVASDINGDPVVGLSTVNFNEEGGLNFTYTNEDQKTGAYLALASFSNDQVLERTNGSLFDIRDDSIAEYGRANSGVLGKIQGGSVELANIELTQEFADMLIIQRGYQASSQIMNVANELIEQLYNNTRS